MAAFDSIYNVDEWISDYYLTTDETKGDSFGKRVDERIKFWKDQESSPWSRMTSRRAELQKALSVLDGSQEPLDLAYPLVEEIFGYSKPTSQEATHNGRRITFEGSKDRVGSYLYVQAQQLQALEDITTTPLMFEVTLDDKPQQWGISTFLSEVFLTDQPPEFIVVAAGNWVIIAERELWPLGRYLTVDLALAVERNDAKVSGELSRVTVALSRECVERNAEGTTWWSQTLEQAHNHSVSVSAELRNAIKSSIEIIGNDVMTRRAERNLPVEDINGNELAKQSLRYLYRILFLLFAEAQPELDILPTGDNEYDEGYGLTRIRDLIITEPASERARTGTHLYQSLQLLFTFVDKGHDPQDPDNLQFDITEHSNQGLTFRGLSADLFQPEATTYIDQVMLSNEALFKVLQNLLLTKEKRGADRGFISYASLGVSELGQVYEGLMSYTGFIAEEDLVEVAPHGDPSKGSWVVPRRKVDADESYVPADSYVEASDELEFYTKGGDKKKNYRTGSFVFRQSSRDRERSASFYSPPVITEFTVGQAIEELLETGRISNADDILTLTICEPAMGSGAFAVEAVRQLAELYLTRKQEELGKQIPGEERAQELQKVKAHIALHQVHGVDLNKTAVELAEISLWLDTMTKELKAPWFGLHLRHGNSLIGATRSTVGATSVKTKKYLTEMPVHHPVTTIQEAIVTGHDDPSLAGRIHRFLLPAKGWGASAASKDLKDIALDDVKAVKVWQKAIQQGFSTEQIATLKMVSAQVEQLWKLAVVRLQIAEDQIRRDIKLWGQDFEPRTQVVMRKQIEDELFCNLNGAYHRLRLAMDVWNALWFWPITKHEQLPDAAEWVSALKDILGVYVPGKAQKDQLGSDMQWDELNSVEEFYTNLSGMLPFDVLIDAHPWLATAIQIAQEQAFFHWDLDFAVVMSKGGFDFQVGNPPWYRPRTDVDGLLAEHDPWFKLANKPTQEEKKTRRELLADDPKVLDTLTKGLAEAVVMSEVLTDTTRYSYLEGQQPDLYRAFIERAWTNAPENGVVALIHPRSHLTEEGAHVLRAEAYLRLRRLWNFTNKLGLFEINRDEKNFDVSIYSSPQEYPNYLMAASVHHPAVITGSLVHDGSGPQPGFKTDEGTWDLRPHADRIITVNEGTLRVWNSILEEPGTPMLHTRTLYSVNSEAAAVLAKLAEAPRVKDHGLQFSRGWDESIDKKKGYFDISWQHAESWSDVILKGTHLGVSTPMIKQPNASMKNKDDLSEIDIEAMPADFIPATALFPNRNKVSYDNDFGTWHFNGKAVAVIGQYRVAWRQMAAPTGFRTMYPAIIPPGTAHINGVISAGQPTSHAALVEFGAVKSSLLNDFFVRSIGSHLWPSIINSTPMALDTRLSGAATYIYLRLNCLTEAYAPLWEEITGEKWTVDTPLRNARERWHAQNEIDAIVALSLDVTLEELLMIYRTQFPVMRRYDREWLYDANGRKVADDVVKLQKKAGDKELSVEERTWTHPQSGATYVFEYPFAPLDREADLTEAYHRYAAQLKEN